MMQRILCPTDLTSDSKDSVAYALKIAKENDAQLTILHVTSFPDFRSYTCSAFVNYQWEQMISQLRVERILAAAEQRLRNFVGASLAIESQNVAWKPRVSLGRVTEEIVTAAIQENADLLVMARRRRGMLARWFLRSTAEAVGRSAPCPVLSIDTSRLVHRPQGWRIPVGGEAFQNS